MTCTKEDRERNAALRRALMRVKPDYFSWSVEKQEKYGVNIPKTEDFYLRRSMIKDLFGIEVATEEDWEEVVQDFGDMEYFKFNSAILPLRGIGDNNFFLNEYLADKTLLDFGTLHDYCYDNYLFQEEAKQRDMPDYEPQPYRGSLYHRWARLTINGRFYYANICSLADHLFSYLDDLGQDTIEVLLPYEYVEGENHGKREGNGLLWDLKPDANGLEGQLEELRFRHYQYIEERYKVLVDRMDKEAARKVYITKKEDPFDPQVEFLFSDQTALQAVHFRHFMKDCEAIAGNLEDLHHLQDQEGQALTRYLEHQYKDIMENFDPKVVRLRKKYKVIMADGALDRLR